MATQNVTIKIKGGLDAAFNPATLGARELAVTTDTGKLYLGKGDGTAIHLNNIPSYLFTGNLVLVSTAGGAIVESAITLTELGVLTGLSTRLTTIETNITNKQDKQPAAVSGNVTVWNAAGQTVDSGSALSDYRKAAAEDVINATKLVKANIVAGTNVVVTPSADPSNNVTISVPGIPLPDKFSSTQNGVMTIGTSQTYDSTLLTKISGSGTLDAGDVIIFANGVQAEVTAVNTGLSQYTAVTVSVPVATSWGTITGTLSNQTDLQNTFNDKMDKVTSPTDNNVITMSSTGNSKNSGIAIVDVLLKNDILDGGTF